MEFRRQHQERAPGPSKCPLNASPSFRPSFEKIDRLQDSWAYAAGGVKAGYTGHIPEARRHIGSSVHGPSTPRRASSPQYASSRRYASTPRFAGERVTREHQSPRTEEQPRRRQHHEGRESAAGRAATAAHAEESYGASTVAEARLAGQPRAARPHTAPEYASRSPRRDTPPDSTRLRGSLPPGYAGHQMAAREAMDRRVEKNIDAYVHVRGGQRRTTAPTASTRASQQALEGEAWSAEHTPRMTPRSQSAGRVRGAARPSSPPPSFRPSFEIRTPMRHSYRYAVGGIKAGCARPPTPTERPSPQTRGIGRLSCGALKAHRTRYKSAEDPPPG
jgi:hypothetical protein